MVVSLCNKGSKVWECELDIYGKIRSIGGESSFIPFRYQGQYEDVETGLYYNRFRYYDPSTGTYMSQDIGLLGNNPNFYAYVYDTNIWIDPFGLNNVSTGAGRDHVTYRGMKGGKPYTGYASAPSSLKLKPEEIVSRRYNGNFEEFGGKAPTPVYNGSGIEGKNTARGLEQHYYEEDVKKHGKYDENSTKGVANKQNPVGPNNKKKGKYEKAKNKHLKGCK